jgi:hypothetical protein
MVFSQQDDSQKLLQTLARLDIPSDDLSSDDAVLAAISDAALLYELIADARAILKPRREFLR